MRPALLVVLVAATGCSPRSPLPTASPPARSRLFVGDPAPPLKGVTWVKGTPIVGFEPGTVYVLDFWATWCGPCLRAMPHLADLQAEYKDAGLVAAAVTTVDATNPPAAIAEYVRTRGAGLDLRFASCDTDETAKAYLEAAGRTGIPCSFVVDKAGKVAFVGHPLELDDVVPKVLAGTWGPPDRAAVGRALQALQNLLARADKDPAGVLAAMPGFEAEFPDKARQTQYQLSKAGVLLLLKRFDDARAATEPVLASAAGGRRLGALDGIRRLWAGDLNPDHRHADLAVRAAEAVLAAGRGADPLALIGAAEAYNAAGDRAKAVDYGTKAVAAAESPAQWDELSGLLDRYKGDGGKATGGK